MVSVLCLRPRTGWDRLHAIPLRLAHLGFHCLMGSPACWTAFLLLVTPPGWRQDGCCGCDRQPAPLTLHPATWPRYCPQASPSSWGKERMGVLGGTI